MPTLADVAKQAGVSVSTASIVLNPGKTRKNVSEELQRKVRKAARELGYVPNYHAQAMKRGQTRVIGLALHTGRTYEKTGTRLDSLYYAAMLAGIEHAIAKRGYSLLILGSTPEELATQRALRAIQQRQIDGLICPHNLLQLELQHSNLGALPVVAIEAPPSLPIPTINWNTAEAVNLAIDHLLAQGHRYILWLGPPPHSQDSLPNERETLFMQESFRKKFQAAIVHLPPPDKTSPLPKDETIINQACEAFLNFVHEQVGKATLPSAVLAYNDTMAAGVYRASSQVGLKIPQQLSVMGFDNFSPAYYLTPPLTTLSHSFDAIGERAVELLLQRIEERISPYSPENPPPHILISPELVVRGSTCPPGS